MRRSATDAMTRRRGTRYWLVKAHRWAGLTACGWLLVLGATAMRIYKL